VLDPAHGGTDSGARGEGSVEKDIVLSIARSVRTELSYRGFRVIMTRNDDSNPSYDDRAAIANANRDSVFVSIHISSTGTAGTARAYYDQFATPDASQTSGAGSGINGLSGPAGNLVEWEEAQRSYTPASRHFADLMQKELAQVFPSSPAASTPAAVRGLRSITLPAVAIEISSVAEAPPGSWTAVGSLIATAIEKSVAAFRPANSGESK
jgi:N-acetylmuramoyl-L-alanine amidase